MRKITIQELNNIAEKGQSELLRCDAEYSVRIAAIADEIYANRDNVGVILLSGPSGSGKTTTALMLEAKLDAMGAETHTISMDNYFLPFTEQQWEIMNNGGSIDFESPERMDIDLLNEQVKLIAECRELRLPIYDFEYSKRYYREEIFQRKPGEIVLFEGIHALNPSVVSFDENQLTNIFVSVDTAVESLKPEYIRLLRRLLRDKRTRSRDYAGTLKMFESVEEGRVKYVDPYCGRAKYLIDSFQMYELNVYKGLIGEIPAQLYDVPAMRAIQEAMNVLKAIPADRVPADALMREFIGE